MKVAIVSGSRSPEPMGLELAELCLLKALRQRSGDAALDIRVVGRRGASRHARVLGGRWIPARPGTLPRRASSGVDIVHLLGLELPPPSRQPFVVTIHDLAPLQFPDEGCLPPWTEEVAARAKLIFAPSKFTACEIEGRLSVPSERIRVIGGGPALEAKGVAPLSDAELSALGVRGPLILRYGGYTTRKRLSLLLDAWPLVRNGTLVLSGPPQRTREDILSRAPSLDRVVVLDYTPSALLARLLRSASILVSTSSYEGFGLPPLEAIAAGTPVVATSSEFVREICGDAALLTESTPDSIGRALNLILADHALASELSTKGLQRAAQSSWSRAAARVLSGYREVASRL
jgi:glycosyltransferase involved in cell wall biosynthesis